MRTNRSVAVSVVTTLLVIAPIVSACTEKGSHEITSAEVPSTVQQGSASNLVEDRLLDLGQGLALALSEVENSTRLRDLLQRSVYPEHKLPIVRHLRGPNGARLLRAIDAHSELAEGDLPQLLSELGDLELYFPIDDHREQWTPGNELILVVRPMRDDETLPLPAFTLSGDRIQVSGDSAPTIPALVLGPSETDFDVVPDRQGWSNVNTNRGSSVGTWVHERWADRAGGGGLGTSDMEPCEGCDGGGGGSTTWYRPADAVFYRGIGVREFIQEMWMPYGDLDGWSSGKPEVDLYIVGTSDTDEAAEMSTKFRVPEDGWLEESNKTPKAFGPFTLSPADWAMNYGTFVQVKCLEDDPDYGETTLSVSVDTKIFGVPVTAKAEWSGNLGGGDDDCGERPLQVRSESGDWTRIYSADDDYRYWWHGTNNLRWNGYGLVY